MDVSIIIPVRDDADRLTKLLESIGDGKPTAWAIEILVADDGSREPLVALCAAHGATCVRLEGVGPAAARNAAAAQAKGDLLLFLDADIVYARGLLESAKTLLDADPDLQAVSFRNRPYTPGDPWVRNYGAAIEHHWFSACLPENAASGEFPGVTTRNMVIRRTAFEALGGFDVSFKTNAIEDYDFGKRLIARYHSALARSPEPYHAFPARVTRLLRNYFVRTQLFVPYFLRHRPALDETQTSGGEARLRLIANATLAATAIAACPTPARPILAAVAGCGLVYCGWRLRAFLHKAWQLSGSWVFAAQCFALYLVSSPAIAAGGVAGLLNTFVNPSGSRREAKS